MKIPRNKWLLLKVEDKTGLEIHEYFATLHELQEAIEKQKSWFKGKAYIYSLEHKFREEMEL